MQEPARPLLDAMGSRVVHFGPPSSGQAVKACNNMVIGISMLALCEGFALAEKMGLDQRKVLDLWMNAGVRSWLLENRCPAPGSVAGRPLQQRLQARLCRNDDGEGSGSRPQVSVQQGIATPFGALALQRYKEFVDAGNGELDFSAIYRTYVTK